MLWSRNRDIIYEKLKYLLAFLKRHDRELYFYLLKNILEFACGYAHYTCNQAIGQNNGLQVLYEKRNKAPHNRLQEFFS